MREPKPKGRKGDLTGQTRWSLTALSPVLGDADLWRVKCDCGAEITLTRAQWFSRRSCGCLKTQKILESLQKMKAPKASWASKRRRPSPEEFDAMRIWRGMLQRCFNKNDTAYPGYGGRGIKVANHWLSFDMFFHDMGPRPSKEHSIERHDVNGHYERGNCSWILKKLQPRNTRRTIRLIYKGVNTTLMEFLELYPMFERKDFMFVSRELKKNGRKPVDVTEALKVLCHFKGVTPP